MPASGPVLLFKFSGCADQNLSHPAAADEISGMVVSRIVVVTKTRGVSLLLGTAGVLELIRWAGP